MALASPTIAEQSAAVSAGLVTQAPAHVLAAFGKDRAALDAAGVPTGVVAVGMQMPDGDLLDVNGAPTSIASTRHGKAAVIVFYRGAWCPYCNIALRTYEKELVPTLKARNIELLAISPQKPDGSLSMQQKNDLTFSTLSDPGNAITEKLGIRTTADDEVLGAQRDIGIDVTQHNADGTAALPMPTTILVDAHGTIRWIDVHPNFTMRSEVADILAAVSAL